MNEHNGKIIRMPDIEYKAWVNTNKDLLSEIMNTGKVSTLWLSNKMNKDFLIRYFKEYGYTITLDD